MTWRIGAACSSTSVNFSASPGACSRNAPSRAAKAGRSSFSGARRSVVRLPGLWNISLSQRWPASEAGSPDNSGKAANALEVSARLHAGWFRNADVLRSPQPYVAVCDCVRLDSASVPKTALLWTLGRCFLRQAAGPVELPTISSAGMQHCFP